MIKKPTIETSAVPKNIKLETTLLPIPGLSERSSFSSPPLPEPEPSPGPIKALLALTQPRGIISSVKSVATNPPPIKETAIPSKIGSDKIKTEPPTKANAVIIIGRVRVSQA